MILGEDGIFYLLDVHNNRISEQNHLDMVETWKKNQKLAQIEVREQRCKQRGGMRDFSDSYRYRGNEGMRYSSDSYRYRGNDGRYENWNPSR